MVAAEDHWDVWNFDYSVADPTDPVAAVAAPARAKVWTRLGSESAQDLDVEDDPFVTAEKTDPSPAVAVTSLTAEMQDTAVVEPKKQPWKYSVSLSESDDSSSQEESTVVALKRPVSQVAEVNAKFNEE